MKLWGYKVWIVVLLAWAGSVQALEFGTVAAPSVILYERPSLKSKKLYVASRHTPLEVVISQNEWVKVRCPDGSLGWVEKRALGGPRHVVVTANLADVRQKPDAAAALVFQARKQVALELLEDTRIGWLKVRHAGGATGYVKAGEVWGG
jgi:SH3-like domain-containing protein